jgi:Zn-dependent protease
MAIAFITLVVISIAVPQGRDLVLSTFAGGLAITIPTGMEALILIAVLAIQINLSLFFFNLLPIPPLDGSRIVRNLLPYNAVVQYDRINGWISYLLMIFIGGFLIRLFLGPAMALVYLALRLF